MVDINGKELKINDYILAFGRLCKIVDIRYRHLHDEVAICSEFYRSHLTNRLYSNEILLLENQEDISYWILKGKK